MVWQAGWVTWVAYVDESARPRPDGSGVYVMAAAVLDPADVDMTREAVAELHRTHCRPFHWKDEEPSDRRKAVAMVAALNSLHLVTVGVGLGHPSQERARRLCMEQLLWHLDQAGVGQAWLDARNRRQNALDVALVDALRARGTIGQRLRVEFAHPFDGRGGELLLWLPDIVAGAVRVARGDGDGQYLAPLESLVTEYRLTLG